MSSKNKVTAALLAIFLGGIGAHKFYFQQIPMGIVYLLFCWTGIPAIIGLIEGLIYLSMSDSDFASKYG
jgi:TM2 domain-containing membrane protein YozV